MTFNPDFSLIRHWGEGWQLPLKPPYVAQFNFASRQLHYIAAQHEGGLASPTLKTVKREFELFKPDVLVVEGMPNTGEISPKWFLKHAQKHARSGFHGSGEGAYAITLAAKQGIDFIAGEPTDQLLFNTLEKQDFSKSDIVHWDVGRMIQFRLQRKLLSESDIKAEAERYGITHLRKRGEKNASYNFDDFMKWYGKRIGTDFSVKGIIELDASPSGKPGVNFFQRMAHASDLIREPHILKTITDQLKKHKKVLVVYGAAHEGKHQPVLQRMLGKPHHIKPF